MKFFTGFGYTLIANSSLFTANDSHSKFCLITDVAIGFDEIWSFNREQ